MTGWGADPTNKRNKIGRLSSEQSFVYFCGKSMRYLFASLARSL